MEAEGPTVSLSWRSSWDSSTTMKVGSEFGHCPPPRTWPVAEGHALEVDRVMRESICQEQTDITRFSPVSLLRPEETTFPSVWCVHSWWGAVISHVMENGEEKNQSPLLLGLLLPASITIHKLKKRRCPLCLEWRSLPQVYVADRSQAPQSWFLTHRQGCLCCRRPDCKDGPWF